MSAPVPDAHDGVMRWLRIVVLGLVAGLVAVGLMIGWVAVELSGGFDDVFSGPPPQPDDPEVVEAREEAAEVLTADARRLSAEVVVPALGEAEALSRSGSEPECQVGQHNWKIDDDFDLACDLVRVEVVATPKVSRFSTDMLALDAVLRDDGWAPERSWGIRRVLADYGDLLGGPRYGLDDLPEARYEKQADGRRRVLEVGWAEQGAGSFGRVPPQGYAVVLTESVEYFRE